MKKLGNSPQFSFLSLIISKYFDIIQIKKLIFTFVSSSDSLDWKDYGVAKIISTVCNHKALTDGSIILLHNGSTYTYQALDELLTKLEGKGYTIVPVSELIHKNNYMMDVTGSQIPIE